MRIVDFEDSVAFDKLVQFFEKLVKMRGTTKRAALVRQLYDTWKGDYFSLLRLVLPHVRLHRSVSPFRSASLNQCQLDRQRQAYGMKENVLAKMYVSILTISVNSNHARQMLQWRRPTAGRGAGDFAAVIEDALQHRLRQVYRDNLIRLSHYS